jgi:hypothetical protein
MACKCMAAIDDSITKDFKSMVVNIPSSRLIKKSTIPINLCKNDSVTPHMVLGSTEQRLREYVPATWMCIKSEQEMTCTGFIMYGGTNPELKEHGQFSAVYNNGFLSSQSLKMQLTWNNQPK